MAKVHTIKIAYGYYAGALVMPVINATYQVHVSRSRWHETDFVLNIRMVQEVLLGAGNVFWSNAKCK